jgi:DNA segregation ATPase FtsK/SpoIIIE, S-DNA-T family
MAKKKKVVSPKKADGEKSRHTSGGRLSLAARLLLIVVVVALLYWAKGYITYWVKTYILEPFGWGLLLIGIFLVAVFIAIIYKSIEPYIKKLSPIIFHFHQWLGGASLLLAIWGVLAFFGKGGSVGNWVIASPDAVGVLRIYGLILLGIILIAPRASSRALVWLFRRLVRKARGQPEKLAAPPPVVDLPAEKATLEGSLPAHSFPPPPAEPASAAAAKATESVAQGKKKPVAADSGPRAPEELKEVAKEVWRKYGEDPSLVTVDGWRLPPIEILDATPEIEFSKADNMNRARMIEESLASYGVEAKVVQINVGPTVTQFGIEPGWDRKMKEVKDRDGDGNVSSHQEEVSRTRVKVERISSLSNDLALSLAAPSIRIEAPVPGKSVVGIEVPNNIFSQVSLRGVIETNVYQKQSGRTKLAVALGKGAGGEAASGDLVKMPHLLIAGATGSGKTVCLNAIICCLLLQNTPYDLKFILVDPKRVELTPFDGIPHLATPVIVDINRALSSLRWLASEMDQRYPKMATAGVRNIEGYNKNRQGAEKMPYLVLVIDELADLMMAGFDEVEQIICRLAQLGRAAGIHLVVATQRPSVDVVTGLIKANFPTRISFAVTSQVDSRTILDIGGAEKLLGRGDMLYMATESAKPRRLQGCYVSDAETDRLVFFWSNQRPQVQPSLKIDEAAMEAKAESLPEDNLIETARQLAREHQQISASFLQRRLRIGYPRAARIMDQLEQEGFSRGEEPPPPSPSV